MRFYHSVFTALLVGLFSFCVFAADDIPSQSANDPAMTTDQQAVTTNINTATAKDFLKVKGINAAKARAIVKYRKKHGNFNSLDDLSHVKGFKKMKPDMMQEIKDQLSV